jgi:hypothetical protein
MALYQKPRISNITVLKLVTIRGVFLSSASQHAGNVLIAIASYNLGTQFKYKPSITLSIIPELSVLQNSSKNRPYWPGTSDF